MVRKIPEHLENPIDNLIYKDMDKISTFFKKYSIFQKRKRSKTNNKWCFNSI